MGIFLYALLWLLFAVKHSLLARVAVQAKLERHLGHWYRFVYNLVAAITILLVYIAGRYLLANNGFSILNNSIGTVLSITLQIAGLITLLVALTQYDIGRFSGITQLRTKERLSETSHEPLQQRGLNRWVRHPLYTGAFLVLWGGAGSSLGLWTAIWGSLYLVIGTHFEERKLIALYKDSYRQYQQQVPRYFPSLRQKTTY